MGFSGKSLAIRTDKRVCKDNQKSLGRNGRTEGIYYNECCFLEGLNSIIQTFKAKAGGIKLLKITDYPAAGKLDFNKIFTMGIMKSICPHKTQNNHK